MAALSHFISWLGKKGLPFFKLLKATEKLTWSKDTDKAFIELKPALINMVQASQFCGKAHEDASAHLMEMGIPIFCQVVVTIVVAENDTPIRLQIERSNPAILAPQLLWLSTETRILLTSPRRLISAYATKNTSKNKKKKTTKLQMND